MNWRKPIRDYSVQETTQGTYLLKSVFLLRRRPLAPARLAVLSPFFRTFSLERDGQSTETAPAILTRFQNDHETSDKQPKTNPLSINTQVLIRPSMRGHFGIMELWPRACDLGDHNPRQQSLDAATKLKLLWTILSPSSFRLRPWPDRPGWVNGINASLVRHDGSDRHRM